MNEINIQRNILLNPGPATTTDTVKMAQIVSDICPREKEFGDVMKFISEGITQFAAKNNKDKYTTVLFGGSGTAGVEAVISSVIGQEDKVAVINNGAYGNRICEMCKIYNINYIEFKSSPTEKVDLEQLEQIFKNDHKITHLAVVHHETTTGILNDVKSMGDLCSRYSIDLIVDAMSSFCGMDINMQEWNIKYLISSSNKCIQGMAGVSFVVCNCEALESTKTKKQRNLYLNLYKQYEYFKSNYQMRFTPPVQVLYALKQAVIELQMESIKERENRYKRCCRILWNGLDKLKLKRLVDDKDASMLLTTIIEPENNKYNFNEMHDYVYKKGFTIYPGKLAGKNTFRIANMGDINEEEMTNFLTVFEEYFEMINSDLYFCFRKLFTT